MSSCPAGHSCAANYRQHATHVRHLSVLGEHLGLLDCPFLVCQKEVCSKSKEATGQQCSRSTSTPLPQHDKGFCWVL
jgi:hypothetical protein